MNTIEAGGPGWLNPLVMLCAWNSIKLTLNGPITLVLFIRSRIGQAADQRGIRAMPACRVEELSNCGRTSARM